MTPIPAQMRPSSRELCSRLIQSAPMVAAPSSGNTRNSRCSLRLLLRFSRTQNWPMTDRLTKVKATRAPKFTSASAMSRSNDTAERARAPTSSTLMAGVRQVGWM
ncbi:hypothetical protein D3C85_1352730 [compost metagenome]